jgi:4,5-dihydroxyphthalate decarboxylase
MEITGADPLPYGIEPNRRMLQEAIASACEQGIIPRMPALEALFPANTHALVA